MNKIKKYVFRLIAVVLVLGIVSMGAAEVAGWSFVMAKNSGDSDDLVVKGERLIAMGKELIAIGEMLVKLGNEGTDDTSVSIETSEEYKTLTLAIAEEKINLLKAENGGSLNGLVEIIPIKPETYSGKLIPQGEAVWEKSGYDLFVSSEAIKLESSIPSSRVNENYFTTKFAEWLEDYATISLPAVNEGRVYLEVNDIHDYRVV